MKSTNKRKFLLDACIPIGTKELLSPNYIYSTEVLPHDAPDEIVFKTAQRRRRLVVTKDNAFILRTICNCNEIVYQSRNGERILLTPTLLEENCPSKGLKKCTKYLLKNNEIVIP